jgi:homoserine O-acetyltransferase
MNSSKDKFVDNDMGEIGIVSPLTFYYKKKFVMENGVLESLQLCYETYGTLNNNGTNAILVCHALTGDHHVAGIYKESDRKGWWDHAVGPGKAIDTNKYFVICSNCLGACQGSTGPSSINPKTKNPYGMGFPDLTIKDMVRAQKLLLDHLKVTSLYSVVGGSMGGMQALQWIIEFPSFVQRAMIIAATPQHSAQTIAFNEVGRTSIKGDPRWNNGDYSHDSRPETGLAVARMMAHITYLSDEGMEQKFGRNQMSVSNSGNKALDEEDKQFAVESYLHYQGNKFVGRFDANTYLKLTKALDHFDLVGEKGLDYSLQNVRSKVMVVGFTSDWLYTPAQNKMIAESLQRLNKNASYLEIDHEHGHDSFLIKSEKFLRLIRLFLNGGDQNEIEHSSVPKSRSAITRSDVKKEADLKVIGGWVKNDEKVLDLGCGRGILLEHLRETKNVNGLGVDYDSDKAAGCISRGVAVYQGDIRKALAMLPNDSFDWVVFSRMVEELPEPGQIILDALRIGKRVAISFVNHGYWKNRLHFSQYGSRIENDVYRENWQSSYPRNHFSINEFESFCLSSESQKIPFDIGRKIFHRGNWRTTCKIFPNLRAGLAIYELVRK